MTPLLGEEKFFMGPMYEVLGVDGISSGLSAARLLILPLALALPPTLKFELP